MSAAVRTAVAPGDYEAASRLFRTLMGETFALDRELFQTACGSEGHAVYVAEDPSTGQVVGITVVVISDRIRLSAGSRRRRFHIDYLIVLPEFRQRGIGRALLDHVRARAEAEAPSYILVNCDFTNVAARRVYESAGFQLVRQAHDRFEIAFPGP